MPPTFRIPPAIGIARLGNSPTSFCIAPEAAGALPIECDQNGNPTIKDGKEVRGSKFTDNGQIRRQAAGFQVFVYDDTTPAGREVTIGDTYTVVDQRSGQLQTVRIDDIQWTAYLANKKSGWEEFRGAACEHG